MRLTPMPRHCALQGRIVSLRQDATHLHYKATWPSTAAAAATAAKPLSVPSPPGRPNPSSAGVEDDTLALVRSYFNLDHSLPALYATWSSRDANFARRSAAFGGVRILNQDAWEALVAFICSSNNNIARIAGMLTRLCARFGPDLGRLSSSSSPAANEGDDHDPPFHDLPGPDALAGPEVESALRALGFGYRARYVAEAARQVATERLPGWLAGLRNPSSSPSSSSSSPDSSTGDGYKAARDALLALPGVGPKVADCVCLMGLGWAEAVPVDTHVWRIARRDYGFGGGSGGSSSSSGKAISKAMYDAVGDHFRAVWGPYAGWAQSVLFTANLRSFAEQAAGGGVRRGTPDAGVDGEEREEKKQVVKVEEREEGEDGMVAVASVAAVGRKRKRKMAEREAGLKVEEEQETMEVKVVTRILRSSKRRKTST